MDELTNILAKWSNTGWWPWVETSVILMVTFLLGYLWGRARKNKVDEIETPISFNHGNLTAADENKIKEPLFAQPSSGGSTQDITVVKGIGPNLAAILHSKGIKSLQDLANADIKELRDILDEAGPQYAVHDCTNWPSEAALALK